MAEVLVVLIEGMDDGREITVRVAGNTRTGVVTSPRASRAGCAAGYPLPGELDD
ncbi:hypothetical protein [Amycolatopsis thermoflava]|uniref:Uncharacterized protein n=1 Tax=Amycolatopsis thermoflava TaxID=84480 RepID=A0A3N2H6S4_9PSEU|nr:hypothetical protein [Amycolatopsis thermoflava]ROS44618.1 hypothetical protein EDD35_7064 [Amycolatopsis thermoflava]